MSERKTNRDELMAWREGWKLVNDVQDRELRALSPEQKLDQLEGLFGLRLGRLRVEDTVIVHERWMRLRRHHARQQRARERG